MALIICPECSKEISDQATKCPKCGVSIKKQVNVKKVINKKALSIIIIVIIIIGGGIGVFLGVQFFINGINDEYSALELRIAQLETLEERIIQLESNTSIAASSLPTTEPTTEPTTNPLIIIDEPTSEPEPTLPESEASIDFTDKISISRDWSVGRYDDRVEFVISVRNNTNRNIRGIQGQLDIQDMFGVSIMERSFDITGKTILSDTTEIFDELGIDLNLFNDAQKKVFNTDFSDLVFEYTVTQIVYE